jgi:hypothetical protein
MSIGLKTPTFAALGFSLIASGLVYAASPVAGFGPAVTGDGSLNESLGALKQVVAWQKSPYGDVYQLALAIPAPEMPFENTASLSIPPDTLPVGLQIADDRTLNASLRDLAMVIAWQNAPEGDAFQYALEDHVKGADFKEIALASIPAESSTFER